MLSEVISGAIVLLFVMIAFQTATKQILNSVEDLKKEFHDMREEFINLVKKLTIVESTYVTHEEFDKHLINDHGPKKVIRRKKK